MGTLWGFARFRARQRGADSSKTLASDHLGIQRTERGVSRFFSAGKHRDAVRAASLALVAGNCPIN